MGHRVRGPPAANVLTAEPGSVQVTRYWQPERLLETGRFSASELTDRFALHMTRAAGRMLTGNDVVSLSGGIDSPAVAAFASTEHHRLFHRPLAGLTAVYPDQPAVDEQRYVEQVAAYLQMPLETYQQRASSTA